MAEKAGVVDRVRRPEYTGENRCVPCTVVNVAMALSGSLLVVTWVAAFTSTTTGLAAGGVVFALALVPIWLRGYLVPGTPSLTARYLPDRVLRWFDKPPEGAVGVHAGAGADGGDLDVEGYLLEAGALEPCRGDDYCLTAPFERRWREERERFAGDHDWAAGLAGFDVVGPDAAVDVVDHDSSFVLRTDGRRIGTWESRVTARADVAAAALLADRVSDWDALSVENRARLAGGLRLFLEECPHCGGPLSFGTNTVQSCCADRTVAVVDCDECAERVFEEPVDPAAFGD